VVDILILMKAIDYLFYLAGALLLSILFGIAGYIKYSFRRRELLRKLRQKDEIIEKLRWDVHKFKSDIDAGVLVYV